MSKKRRAGSAPRGTWGTDPLARGLASFRRDPQTEEPALLGLRFLEAGRLREALETIELARLLEPQDADVLVVHGRVLMALGDHRGACGPLADALRVAPEWKTPRRLLYRSLMRLGRYRDAVALRCERPGAFETGATNNELTGDTAYRPPAPTPPRAERTVPPIRYVRSLFSVAEEGTSPRKAVQPPAVLAPTVPAPMVPAPVVPVPSKLASAMLAAVRAAPTKPRQTPTRVSPTRVEPKVPVRATVTGPQESHKGRAHTRVPIRLRALVAARRGEDVLMAPDPTAEVADVSAGGLFVRTDSVEPPGTLVSVMISPESNDPITVSGRIAWTGKRHRIGHGMGIELGAGGGRVLAQLLSRV